MRRVGKMQCANGKQVPKDTNEVVHFGGILE